jgi:hypothetical protein
MALLAGLALPAARMIIDSFESGDSARSMISAALASARAIAAKERKYAGIRFQNEYERSDRDPQYMVFIIQDPNLDDSFTISRPFTVVDGFRAVKGLKPMKLPETVGVVELVGDIAEIDDDVKVMENTTFSVVFSPRGKLVIHDVQVLRENARDKVFNEAGSDAMFVDDYYGSDPAFHRERSQNSFIIYDRTIFGNLDVPGRFDYLRGLEVVYINPYMGTLISKD